jgi:N-acetylmuramoyl-L-alanine amidase
MLRYKQLPPAKLRCWTNRRMRNLVLLPLVVFIGGVLPLTYVLMSRNVNETTGSLTISSLSTPMTPRPVYLQSAYHWRASPNFDARPLSADNDLPPQIDTIVLHATELPVYELVEAVFMSLDYKVSSHYTIDRDGTIYSHVDESQRAWHAGASLMPDGRQRANDFSIGIELVNANDGIDPYPKSQVASLKALIDDIRSRHTINHLVSHAEIATPPGRKSDPRGFPWDQISEKMTPNSPQKVTN